jgi:hypothetical protein
LKQARIPLVTININGQITGMNEATVKNYRLEREKLIGTDFSLPILQNPNGTEVYQEVFAKGSVADSAQTPDIKMVN